MRKICLFLGLLFLPMMANATTVVYLGTSQDGYGNLPQADNINILYKCANGLTWTGCNTNHIKITYESKSGSGSALNPYLLSGCNFVSCACMAEAYLSGTTTKTCTACSAHYYAHNITSGKDQFHTNTSCDYCAPDYYKDGSTCKHCPETSERPGISKDGITKCCYEEDTADEDETGEYECSVPMCYIELK